jgi:antitoxin component of MazEF toxin-antitoxin module
MIKKLTTHGNSMALVIEKAILDLLHITPNTSLEISTDGKNIVISPIHEAGREKTFKTALDKVNKKHGKTLKALA